MTPRASKLCGHPGCTNLSGRDSRCPEHARPAWSGPRTESAKRTGTRRFNQKIRPAVLERDGGLCRVMGPTCTRLATEVHHVVEVSAGGDDSLTNLVSICEPCHQWVTTSAAARLQVTSLMSQRNKPVSGPTPPLPPSLRRARRPSPPDKATVMPKTIWIKADW
ncbi:MAG: HNH endonuclease [Mycobacterium sp.]|uniref:HNH endonuclease n=1 Tax=Mycobacterium sp. TaxID=1785 RepID=UPI003F96A9C4